MSRLPVGTEVRVASSHKDAGGERGVIVAYLSGSDTGYVVKVGRVTYAMWPHRDFRTILKPRSRT